MSFHPKAITREDHLAFVRARASVSHMQVPSWGDVKPDWRAESLGWFDESDRLVGVGLVLLRPLPKLKRYLAYLPEGPVIDWAAPDLERWLEPMLAYLSGQGAFSVKMGPPVVARRWSAEAVKAAIADPRAGRLRDAEATVHEPRAFDIADRLRRMGWQQTEPGGDDGFAAGQPRYVFQVPFAGRSLEEVQRCLNQQWRRNIKKAEKAGVKVVQGDYEDLPAFYQIYVETAERDRFMPRPLAYFQRMLVFLRRLHQPQARGPAEQRHPVADDVRRPRARRERLRLPRHHRHPGGEQPPAGAVAVQGRHGRRGRRVPRGVGLPA
jgi:lipid II:glycine glycyltransferase (peptidoglycan interpeptide bridge formation enzyme)